MVAEVYPDMASLEYPSETDTSCDGFDAAIVSGFKLVFLPLLSSSAETPTLAKSARMAMEAKKAIEERDQFMNQSTPSQPESHAASRKSE
jgi:hypothetical protein